MKKTAPYIVMLLALFIFSLLFLVSSRDGHFFQIDFNLGLKLYLILTLLIIYFFEYLIENLHQDHSVSSASYFIAFPFSYAFVLIVLLFIVFSITESPRSMGHGSSGFIGLYLLFIVIIGGFIYGVVRAIFFVSVKNQPDLITLAFKFINSSLNKNFKPLVPALSISSLLVFSLAYFDFKTNEVSDDSYIAALNEDLNAPVPQKQYSPKQLIKMVPCSVDPNDSPSLYKPLCRNSIDKQKHKNPYIEWSNQYPTY